MTISVILEPFVKITNNASYNYCNMSDKLLKFYASFVFNKASQKYKYIHIYFFEFALMNIISYKMNTVKIYYVFYP